MLRVVGLPTSSQLPAGLTATRRQRSQALANQGHKRNRLSVMAAGRITGKTVVVTGANRGLGLEWVRQLLAQGNSVYAAVRDPSKAKELTSLKDARVTQLDVSNPASIQEWAKKLASQVDHIDYVINNAGVIGAYQDFEHVTAEDMLAVFQTNTIGPLLITQQLLRNRLIGSGQKVADGPGSVIANVTSKVGSVDDNRGGGGYAYRASKSALNNVNKSMSIDLARRGIAAVLLHPGYVRTGMTGGNGLIDVDQAVAGMLSVLESDLPLNGHWYDYKQEAIPW
ncbi:hypothetical protein WJX72_006821 [[Myrmecia] bisecta]|uniref:Uncharacterized protein n=1 Tax=[Myrmecia] bisecta TaxID=41462 RepID=A0AAW1R7H4_9CHLO